MLKIRFSFQNSYRWISVFTIHIGIAQAISQTMESNLPYLDPAEGRSEYTHSSFPDNESRIYDFYSRQARFHLEQKSLPSVLPPFPGLDGESFGHWGRHSKMDKVEDRWSKQVRGGATGVILSLADYSVTKAVVARLGTGATQFSACFDPETLNYSAIWQGDLKLPAMRWGLMGRISPDSPTLFESSRERAWPEAKSAVYHGYHNGANSTVFEYSVDGTTILDQTVTDEGVLVRSIEFLGKSYGQTLALCQFGESWKLEEYQPDQLTFNSGHNTRSIKISGNGTRLRTIDNSVILDLGRRDAGDTIQIVYATESLAKLTDPGKRLRPSEQIKSYPRNWDHSIVMPGTLSRKKQSYVVDTLPVPLSNPYASPMFLTGIDFFENGDAAVSTFFGDVWIVSGIDENLRSVTWKRFATGLNQPLGLKVIDGLVYTIGRDQITRLHDKNDDKEADFYECFNNKFESSIGSHDFNTGLQTDERGYLYFASKTEGIYRVSPDGAEGGPIASGIRNPNGLAVTPDGTVITSPQEGQLTPASMIIKTKGDQFFGYQMGGSPKSFDLPLCYIPRGIDNSTGGQVFADSTRWGPLSDHLISLSYGYCSHYLVLSDQNPEADQGAIVPLSGEFLSGVHRGRVNPVDGQMYLVGTQGWGTYARFDGSLERVRYTGLASYYPTGFEVLENSIRVEFSEPLSAEESQSTRNFFAQSWNYQYSPAYGSPEYSIKEPETPGHDPIEISGITVLADQRSLLIDFPKLEPAMQFHLHLNPSFASGVKASSDIFLTLKSVPTDTGRETLNVPAIWAKQSDKPASITTSTKARTIELSALASSAYSTSSFSVQSGQAITLHLKNEASTPRNWVLADSGSYLELGQLADALAKRDPDNENGFVPQSSKVIAHTGVVQPGELSSVIFVAPTTPGSYVFFCSLPGKWKQIRGTMMVY
ncbi:DUF6797 domain-containing protein [Pelagicoccus mobilis]|uniref:Blue (type 1) copper domain-containing protein n=1 Tax=Pelagicoccus mobilis TaxID=415221 RepID=A0A934RZ32_9BACT|nr:DUF6797 domain-containing protein [Pelagicoccus mobilis]MBK1876474.1 hypothetical protein [Pelagicoccus mobilis]